MAYTNTSLAYSPYLSANREHAGVTVRPACADDAGFLFDLYASTRHDEIAAWGLPAASLEPLLRMQHHCQQQSHALHYPQASDNIVLLHGQRAGRVLTATSGDDIVVVDLALLPPLRGQGLGTTLLLALQQHAAASGCGLRLHVLADNPARALYARLGFREDADKPPYVAMHWPCPASQSSVALARPRHTAPLFVALNEGTHRTHAPIHTPHEEPLP